MIGVRPAVNRMGTCDREALMIAPTPFAVPTVTCTITAWGRPVTS